MIAAPSRHIDSLFRPEDWSLDTDKPIYTAPRGSRLYIAKPSMHRVVHSFLWPELQDRGSVHHYKKRTTSRRQVSSTRYLSLGA